MLWKGAKGGSQITMLRGMGAHAKGQTLRRRRRAVVGSIEESGEGGVRESSGNHLLMQHCWPKVKAGYALEPTR